MPYDPHITDIRGQLLGQGIQAGAQNAMSGIVEAITEARKAEAQNAGGDVILDFARKQGLLTPELEAEYHTGNMNKKNGIIANLTRTFALEQQKQVLDNQNARLKMEQDATNFQPKIVDLGNGQKVIAVSPGHFAIPKTGSAPFTPPTTTTPVFTPDGKQVGQAYQTGPKNVTLIKPPVTSAATQQQQQHFDIKLARDRMKAEKGEIEAQLASAGISEPTSVLDPSNLQGGHAPSYSKGEFRSFQPSTGAETLAPPLVRIKDPGKDRSGKQLPNIDVPASKFTALQALAARHKELVDGLAGKDIASEGKTSPTADGYGVPKVGTVKGNYKFKGGDPAVATNWEPL